MLIKKNPRLLLFALLGMTYLAGISQIEGIPVFLTGYVALVPIQIGVLGYLWLSGYLRPSRYNTVRLSPPRSHIRS